MKRIPVDECPAGPALDAAVAEVYKGPGVKLRVALETFQPSTDIAAAWELLESLTEDESGISLLPYLNRDIEGEWWMGFDTRFVIKANTAPLAITRAYLKVKDVEWVEVPD